MMDYAGNGPAAALDISEPQLSRLRSTPSEPRPLPSPAPRIVPLEDAERDADPVGQSGLSATEQRLEAFIGLNCESYLGYYQNVYRAGNKNPLRHWHWVPFVFSTVWLFTRRRYVAAAFLGSVPVVANYLFPGGQAMAIAFIAVAACCGVAGRPLYMTLALRKIARIEARRLWPVQRDDKLHRGGGVSMIGAALGGVLWAATAAMPFFLG